MTKSWSDAIPASGIGLAAVGIGIGLASSTLAVVIVYVMQALLPLALWGASAAAGLSSLSPTQMLIIGIVVAPLLETVVGQLLPIEFAAPDGQPADVDFFQLPVVGRRPLSERRPRTWYFRAVFRIFFCACLCRGAPARSNA